MNNGLNLMGVKFYWQYVAKGLVLGTALTIDILGNRPEILDNIKRFLKRGKKS